LLSWLAIITGTMAESGIAFRHTGAGQYPSRSKVLLIRITAILALDTGWNHAGMTTFFDLHLLTYLP